MNKPTQQTEPTHRWIRPIMLAGLVCILIGVVILSFAQNHTVLTDVGNLIGYLGLALFLLTFLVRISIE